MRFGRVAAPLAATCLFVGASAATPQQPILLTYEPIMQADGKHFSKMHVSLRFPGDSDGRSEIDLPNEWGGYSKYYENLSNIRVEGAQREHSDTPEKLILSHKPGATITLSYDVTGVNRPDKLSGSETVNEYRPIINPDYFHLIGDTVVPYPVHISGDADARFVIKGMPAGMRFASDLEHSVKGRLKFDALIESVAVGGDFRILSAGSNVRLAVRGKFNERDDAGWVDAFKRVSAAVSSYWTTKSGPYLVTILPFEPSMPGATSIGGTGRRDAFAFFSTTNGQVDQIDQIMTHEMTHSWMPRRVGGITPDENKQEEEYWLSEGFTDFATWRALVRAGVWTPERYFAEINRTLQEYDANPHHATSNVETAKLFWTGRDGQRIAYLRGALFAVLLDSELQKGIKQSSLRSVLLAMQADAAKSDDEGQAIALLRKETKKVGLPIDELNAHYIDRGEAIEFGSGLLPDCGQIRSTMRPKFHRGFDIQATQANDDIITGVIQDGRAWRAGLRNGMKLIDRSGGAIGDSMIEIAYDVEDKGVKKTLRWMPQLDEQETIRTFITALDKPDARKACIAALSR